MPPTPHGFSYCGIIRSVLQITGLVLNRPRGNITGLPMAAFSYISVREGLGLLLGIRNLEPLYAGVKMTMRDRDKYMSRMWDCVWNNMIRKALTILAVIALLLLVIAGALTVVRPIMIGRVANMRQNAIKKTCAKHIMNIVELCQQYAKDNNAAYPSSFKSLVGQYELGKVGTCPDFDTSPISDPYHIVPGLTTSCAPTQILIYEDPSIHGGKWVAVFFCDGSIHFVAASTLKAILTQGGVAASDPSPP